jgi:hypothetical protein
MLPWGDRGAFYLVLAAEGLSARARDTTSLKRRQQSS